MSRQKQPRRRKLRKETVRKHTGQPRHAARLRLEELESRVLLSASDLLFGNPTNAESCLVTDTTCFTENATNLLIDRDQYALSYNMETGTPNWAAWHLTADSIGEQSRKRFRIDRDIPDDWVVRSKNYTGSGWDRGHMVPHKDRSSDYDDAIAVSYMTNIVPRTRRSTEGPG